MNKDIRLFKIVGHHRPWWNNFLHVKYKIFKANKAKGVKGLFCNMVKRIPVFQRYCCLIRNLSWYNFISIPKVTEI